MHYQVSWKTEPGLRGLSCSSFRAVPTSEPDNERGVAVELLSDTARDAFLRELETHFAAQRFMNTAAAFDSVRDYVQMRVARNQDRN